MKAWMKDAGNIRNMILLGILVLVGGKRLVEVYEHPPEAAEAFQAVEMETDAIQATLQNLDTKLAEMDVEHAHDDSVKLFGLCRQAKMVTMQRRQALAECLHQYPTLMELGVAELNALEQP